MAAGEDDRRTLGGGREHGRLGGHRDGPEAPGEGEAVPAHAPGVGLAEGGPDIKEPAGEIHDRMKNIGASLLVKTVKGLAYGTLKETPQKELLQPIAIDHRSTLIKHAPKIVTETAKIYWNEPVDEIYNLVRGLSPYPGAFTYLDNKILKIYKGEKEKAMPLIPPGLFETDKKTFIRFAGKDGYISLKEIQLEGKKKLTIEDFLRGYRW